MVHYNLRFLIWTDNACLVFINLFTKLYYFYLILLQCNDLRKLTDMLSPNWTRLYHLYSDGLIPHGDCLPFDLIFKWQMALLPICIPWIITVLVLRIWLPIIYFWVYLRKYCVHPYIGRFFHSFFSSLVCISQIFPRYFSIFINLTSARTQSYKTSKREIAVPW